MWGALDPAAHPAIAVTWTVAYPNPLRDEAVATLSVTLTYQFPWMPEPVQIVRNRRETGKKTVLVSHVQALRMAQSLASTLYEYDPRWGRPAPVPPCPLFDRPGKTVGAHDDPLLHPCPFCGAAGPRDFAGWIWAGGNVGYCHGDCMTEKGSAYPPIPNPGGSVVQSV